MKKQGPLSKSETCYNENNMNTEEQDSICEQLFALQEEEHKCNQELQDNINRLAEIKNKERLIRETLAREIMNQDDELGVKAPKKEVLDVATMVKRHTEITLGLFWRK